MLKEDTAVKRLLHRSRFGEVRLLHTNGIWDVPEVLEKATFQISSGSMSPDLGDTRRQGQPLSPQWDDELKLGLDDIVQAEYEDEKLDSLRARNYIRAERKSSQWAPLCDCLTLADVLVLRTTGPKWYIGKLYGEFTELWLFLMKRIRGDGPSFVPQSERPKISVHMYVVYLCQIKCICFPN